MKYLNRFLIAIYRLNWYLLFVALVSALPLGGIHYLFGLLRSVGSYFFLGCFVGLLLVPLLMWRRAISSKEGLIQAFFLALIAGLHFIPMFGFLEKQARGVQLPQASEHSISVYYANVERGNAFAPENIKRDVERYLPDVVALVEATPRFVSKLPSIEGYSYQFNAVEDSHFGILIFSKYPLSETKHLYDYDEFVRVYNGEILLPNGPLSFLVVHPPPPVFEESWSLHTKILREIANKSRASKLPILVVGDLNATPNSYAYLEMLKAGKLVNAMEASGAGWKPTWNMHSSVIRLPIDYVLYSPSVILNSFQVLTGIGSDHLPLLATIEPPSSEAVLTR